MSENYLVAICTLGVNPNLVKCISNLLEIQQAVGSQLRILIVLNRDVGEFAFDSRVEVVFEPNRGYSNVRNCAIQNTPADYSLIFIDDDEIPTRSWFEALVASHLHFPRDVIFGPVLAEQLGGFDSYRDKFKSKFDSLPDGALVKQAGAGNMLLPSYLLNLGVVEFDPFFNESGSEDTDLCFRLRKIGVGIRYSKSAKIFEVQAKERVTAQYMNARALKDISNYSLVVRRNSGAIGISWRLLTLSIRVIYFSVMSRHGDRNKFLRMAYFNSLQALLRGQ
jgi:glycosyltransferase involved in cell wall biosynthesis